MYMMRYTISMSDSDKPKLMGRVDRDQHIAYYYDGDGVAHRLSSYCTHEFCDVEWDGDENNWHCPCHGARYTPTGQVLKGPAIEPLRPLRDHE